MLPYQWAFSLKKAHLHIHFLFSALLHPPYSFLHHSTTRAGGGGERNGNADGGGGVEDLKNRRAGGLGGGGELERKADLAECFNVGGPWWRDEAAMATNGWEKKGKMNRRNNPKPFIFLYDYDYEDGNRSTANVKYLYNNYTSWFSTMYN